MYPLLLKPVLKQILWGGSRLRSDFGFEGALGNIAEGWMLTCREDGVNEIINGEYAGKTLSEVIAKNEGLLGSDYKGGAFPLLIKLIDAESDLSVQVHPGDDYAERFENSTGKTEAWYILDCDSGAELIYGFNKKLTKDQFRKSIADNTFLEHVNRVKVKKGDFFYIPFGTLHAIGKGILLAEVQQNCNTTYRVYDYNRLENGKSRPLHIDRAVDVAVTEPLHIKTETIRSTLGNTGIENLCECEYFKIKTADIDDVYNVGVSDKSFVSIIVLEGSGAVSADGVSVDVKKGASVFIAAKSRNVTLSGKLKALISEP